VIGRLARHLSRGPTTAAVRILCARRRPVARSPLPSDRSR
jgi:hypothetical protein